MKKRLQSTNPHINLAPNLSSTRHTIRHFLQAMRGHDPALIEHGKRTAIYSLLLGQAIHLSNKTLSELCYAALLHDLGKLTLPNEVIHQKGLSMIGEYLMTECSPQAGAEILRSWPGLQEIAKLVALHHERWDGNGEPFGMRGTLIPLGARILSLADTVDQLLTQKDDLISDQISPLIRILRAFSGTRFDPTLVEIFIKVLPSTGKHLEFFSLYECCQPTEQLNLLFRPSTSTKISNIGRHLKNILELTNPVSLDSIPASVTK